MKGKGFTVAVSLGLLLGLLGSLLALANVQAVHINTNDLNAIVKDSQKVIQIKQLIEVEGYLVIKEDTLLTLKALIGLSFGFLVLILGIYFFYLRRNILKPFQQLKTYASHVATGNLDLPLPIDRQNAFGLFSESFDLLRVELKKSREREHAANKAKKELIAGLSHDIKTPIASIKAISELTLATNEDDKLKGKLKIIYDKAEQINHLVTDMFHATLEELGELSVTVQDEYSTLLLGILTNADYLHKAKLGVIPECILSMDKVRLWQVIDNIFANSYKYAGTEIEILFHLSPTYLEIDISDYGPGVEDEELPLLYNKFYRGKNAVQQEGYGLGLFISKYLMEKQNGDLMCFNTKEGFTTRLILSLSY